MLVAIIGENCVGKSTLANKICERKEFIVYSGKDYLRLEKNSLNAEKKFIDLLKEAVTGDNIIYVISEADQLKYLPEGAFKIVVTADIEIIKKRFSQRMKGILPKPVEIMLEKKHGLFDNVEANLRIESDKYNIEEIMTSLFNE